MLGALMTLLLLGIAGIVVLSLVFAVLGMVMGVVGFLLFKVFPDVRGSGVPQTETAYHLSNGYIPGRVPFGKFVAPVLLIGWVVLKLVERSRGRKRISAADRKWLDG